MTCLLLVFLIATTTAIAAPDAEIDGETWSKLYEIPYPGDGLPDEMLNITQNSAELLSGGWLQTAFPDFGWGCVECEKYYITFINGLPSGLQFRYASDNTVKMYINGSPAFDDNFGERGWCTGEPCCNLCCNDESSCNYAIRESVWHNIDTERIKEFFHDGENVLIWRVRQGLGGSGFNLMMALGGDTSVEPIFGESSSDQPGLRANVYYLAPGVKNLPYFTKLKPSGNLYTRQLDIPQTRFNGRFPGISGRFESFAIRYTGYFNIITTGWYKFHLTSDDGSRLLIDGKGVIDNDGTHPQTRVNGTIYLSKGNHEIEVQYFNAEDESVALELGWTPPDGHEEIFSPVYIDEGEALSALAEHAFAHYSLDTNALDFGGGGYHGRVAGPVPSADRRSNTRSAMWFDGADDYISIEDNELFDLVERSDSLTVVVWINERQWYQGASGGIFPIINKYESSGDTGWGLELSEKRGIIFFNGLSSVNCPVLPRLNAWNNIAFSYSRASGIARFFVNDLLMCSERYSEQVIDTSGEPLYIGFSPSGDEEFSEGSFDDLWIYPRMLSDKDISDIADVTEALRPSDLDQPQSSGDDN